MSNTREQARIEAFAQWKQLAHKVNAEAKASDDALHEAGWALAATVGIPRDGCCLHNASIDDELNGWCAGNPQRLVVAKEAKALVSSFPASREADLLIKSEWNRLVAEPFGYAKYEVPIKEAL